MAKQPTPGPYSAVREHGARNGWKGIGIFAEDGRLRIANMVMSLTDNEWETAQLIAKSMNEHAARSGGQLF